MKKRLLPTLLLAATAIGAHAGGLMTNTNYHIAFDRMFARGATFDIDAAYSNPAGLAWTPECWQLSVNLQKPWQRRDIETDIPGFLGQDFHHKYDGKASAPIVPALFAVYRRDRLALSAMVGIVGSGGYVEYADGVPMYNVMLTSMLAQRGIMPSQYELSSEMKGKQYIYGGQVSVTYRLTEHVAAAVGLRANYYDGYYRGYVVADQHPVLGPLAALRLDVDQRDWGFAPIVGIDYHRGPLTVGARYEFRTKISTKNHTNQLDASLGQGLQQALAATDPATLAAIATTLGERTAAYADGARTRYDMPSLLTLAVGYELTPRLRAAVEYHYFDDKHAQMAADRQRLLEHGTHEVLAGVEWDATERLTLSCGGQRTDYGLSDDYQQNTSFACDSYSVGLGGAYRLNDRMRLNVSYFCTLYSDYTRSSANYLGTPYPGTDTYSRTNNVVGVGLDYRF